MIAVNRENGNSDVQVGIFVIHRGKAEFQGEEMIRMVRLDSLFDEAYVLKSSCFAIVRIA